LRTEQSLNVDQWGHCLMVSLYKGRNLSQFQERVV